MLGDNEFRIKPERQDSAPKRLKDMSNSPKHKGTSSPHVSSPTKPPGEKEISLKDLKYPFQANNWKKVLEAHEQLEEVSKILDQKMNIALVKTEHEFLRGYNMYVNKKNNQIQELVTKYKERNSNLSIKDEKISKLEKLFIAEEQKESKIKEAMKWKMKGEILEQDKKFLEKQLKDARKQNRLLKIAISKLQNDFERVARHTQHPIEINYSLHENDKNNLLERLERVMEENKEENLDNDQILQKLEETCDNIGVIAATKIDSHTAYTTDNGLRDKLRENNQRNNSVNYSSQKNKSFQKYESAKKSLEYSPNKNKKAIKQDVPVGSAQKVSSIKKKLGGDEKWNQFCSEFLKEAPKP